MAWNFEYIGNHQGMQIVWCIKYSNFNSREFHDTDLHFRFLAQSLYSSNFRGHCVELPTIPSKMAVKKEYIFKQLSMHCSGYCQLSSESIIIYIVLFSDIMTKQIQTYHFSANITIILIAIAWVMSTKLETINLL